MGQIFSLLFLFFGVVFPQAPGNEFGEITLPLGKVSIKKLKLDNWERALPKQKLFVGEHVRTLSKSRCEITLKTGGKVRIGENSELELGNADIKPMEKNYNASLKKGNIWVSVKAAFGEKKNVSINTPTAVAAIRGTKYRAVADSAESSVLIYEGEVDVNAAKNMVETKGKEEKDPQEEKPKFKLGPVEEIEAPKEIPGPYKVSLEDWVKLVEGWQINIRKDGKYNLFEFDKTADGEVDFVKWNKEQDNKE